MQQPFVCTVHAHLTLHGSVRWRSRFVCSMERKKLTEFHRVDFLSDGGVGGGIHCKYFSHFVHIIYIHLTKCTVSHFEMNGACYSQPNYIYILFVIAFFIGVFVVVLFFAANKIRMCTFSLKIATRFIIIILFLSRSMLLL